LVKHPDPPVPVTEGEKKADTGERLIKSHVTGPVGRAAWVATDTIGDVYEPYLPLPPGPTDITESRLTHAGAVRYFFLTNASEAEAVMEIELAREQLLDAYRYMRLIREFEERIHLEFATGEIPGFVHLYAGEEASAVGVCMNLGERDYIASTHRGHGHCIAKGCDIAAMMKELYGRRDGLCGGKGGSMHVADMSKGMMGANGIVGGGPPLV
jgi:hypothetical protein